MARTIKTRRLFLAQGASLALASTAFGQSKEKPHRMVDGRIIYGDFVIGADSAVVDGPVHDGVEIEVDLPTKQHIRNFAMPPGPSGKGLCVFASMTMAARWHHVRELSDVVH